MVPFEFTDRSRDNRNTRIISGLFISFFLSPQSSIFFLPFFVEMKTPKEKKKEGGISIVSRNLLRPFANLPHLRPPREIYSCTEIE